MPLSCLSNHRLNNPSHPSDKNNENMNNKLELNRIALWKPKLFDELTVRECGAGRPYVEDNIIKKTIAKTYRYAKNYKRGNHTYCLFVITYANNTDIVERQLDNVSKKIKVADIESALEISTDSSFNYTNYYLEEK